MSSREQAQTVQTQDETSPGWAPVVKRMDELVGNTPLVRLRRIGSDGGPPIYLKMENLNPSGSIRDRYIAEIVERAVAAGLIMRDDQVALAGIDDSAVAAALVGAVLGLKTKIFAPQSTGGRLLELVRRYGATVEWTSPQGGLREAVDTAAAWARESADRIYVDGYRRQAVRDAYTGIAGEILHALEGAKLGAFITSISTGGTFRHVARELRETRPNLNMGGAILGELELPDFREHQFNVLRRFSLEEAFAWRDRIAHQEGLLVGPKGAVCVGLAVELQERLDSDQAIVALNPDSGQRYLGWEEKVSLHGSPAD